MQENARLDFAEKLIGLFNFYREHAPPEIQERFRMRYETAIIQIEAGDHVEAITSLFDCIRAIYWELRTTLPDSTLLWDPADRPFGERDGK